MDEMKDLGAGKTLVRLPKIVPEGDAWEQNRVVVTTCAISAEGDPAQFVELDADQALLLARGAVFLLRARQVDPAEEKEIEKQRTDACTRGDGVIEAYLGTTWQIKDVYGDADGKSSSIRVTGRHPNLGRDGLRSLLCAELLRTGDSKYYDLRAVADDDGRYLLVFWADGKWHAWIGRELERAEIDAIEVR